MKTKIERRWTVVAFKHPDLEHSVYYRKGIKHLDRAVKTAEEKGANLMSIRGFDVRVTYGDPVPKDQTTLEEAARFTSDHPRALQYEEFDSLKGNKKE